MTKKIIVRSEAEADISDAYKWYESQRKGLGENFLLCIEEALARVSRKPSIYSQVHKDVRRILIHRFPFGIFLTPVFRGGGDAQGKRVFPGSDGDSGATSFLTPLNANIGASPDFSRG